MTTSGPVAESPIGRALRLANRAFDRGLIGGYAIAGAFASVYYETSGPHEIASPLESAPDAIDHRKRALEPTPARRLRSVD